MLGQFIRMKILWLTFSHTSVVKISYPVKVSAFIDGIGTINYYYYNNCWHYH